MIIALRTDKPEAEITLHDAQGKELSNYEWLGHRQLSATILKVAREQLGRQNADWQDISGIVIFQGPGSFTGLRIGVATANALAFGLHVPIVGSAGDDWRRAGIAALLSGRNDNIVLPAYGGEANISVPKK